LAELLTIDEAQRLILERIRPLGPEPVPLEEAGGRILVETAAAVVDLPPFPSSAMDGFALRAEDTWAVVVARIAAGAPARASFGRARWRSPRRRGSRGSRCRHPFEYVVENDNSIEVSTGSRCQRPRGGDIRAGDSVVEAGSRPGLRSWARWRAGAGRRLRRRPRAAVLTTGTELRSPGEPLGPGEVYEANGLIPAAQLASAGASRRPRRPTTRRSPRGARNLGGPARHLGGVSSPHDLVPDRRSRRRGGLLARP
jgi:molybdopterin molybdotransferase